VMKSVDWHCSLLLLILWWRWWSDTLWVTHKVMTALIVILPSNCCSADFSAIS
jgi:hypothetical protein